MAISAVPVVQLVRVRNGNMYVLNGWDCHYHWVRKWCKMDLGNVSVENGSNGDVELERWFWATHSFRMG